MDQAKFSRVQSIRSKRDEVATIERDLDSKKNDLAQLEAEHAAAESRSNVKFVETPAENAKSK